MIGPKLGSILLIESPSSLLMEYIFHFILLALCDVTSTHPHHLCWYISQGSDIPDKKLHFHSKSETLLERSLSAG